jgi:integrase
MLIDEFAWRKNMAKKRGQNEGIIYRRKNGTWAAQVSVDGRRLTKYTKTQTEARSWLRTTLNQVDNGITFLGAQMELGNYLGEWLETVKTSVRPKTYVQYKQIVMGHIVPVFGRIKLKDLRPDQIQSLYNNKLKMGASNRTVRMIHSVLHVSLAQALKMGLIGRNPADAVTRPKLIRKEMKTLTDIQVQTLLLAVRGNRYEDLYLLAVTSGLREGELLGLMWTDLDWITRHLSIQRQLQRLPNQGLVFTEPKSASGRRVIVLGSSTIEKLREHYQRQRLERLAAGERWVENDLMFPSTIGTPTDWRNVVRDFKAILRASKLPNIRFHDLRHTAATLMLQQGIHPKVVQERLGHSQISLTLDTYSHVLPNMQEEAAEKIDELILPVAVRLQ